MTRRCGLRKPHTAWGLKTSDEPNRTQITEFNGNREAQRTLLYVTDAELRKKEKKHSLIRRTLTFRSEYGSILGLRKPSVS